MGDQLVTQLKRALVGMGACLLIAGCQTKGIYSAVGDAHIVDISVQSNAKTLPPTLLPDVREGLRTKLSVYPKSGRPKCMTVVIKDYHLKNAALSLLVGDSNRMGGTVQTVDATTGALDGNKQVVALDSYMMNGVIGAAQAATQDKAKVENILADTFQLRVLEALYGSDHKFELPDKVDPPRISSNEAATATPVSAAGKASATPRCGGARGQA